MRFNDAIIGAVLVGFAVAEITYTRTFPSLHGQSYGPDLFPRLIGLGLAGCGVVLIARGLIARRNARLSGSDLKGGSSAGTGSVAWFDLGNITESKHARTNALLIVLSLLTYIFLSDWIGFIPLSFVTIAFLLHRLGSSAIVSIVVALVTTAVIQVLFARVLLVPLPAGWLQDSFLQRLLW